MLSLVLTVVATACRTGAVVGHPVRHVGQTAPVSTALAPHEQSPHYGVADGAPGGGSLAPVTPPGPAGLAHALPAPRAPGVDGGGLLVLGVHGGQGALAQHLQHKALPRAWSLVLIKNSIIFAFFGV